MGERMESYSISVDRVYIITLPILYSELWYNKILICFVMYAHIMLVTRYFYYTIKANTGILKLKWSLTVTLELYKEFGFAVAWIIQGTHISVRQISLSIHFLLTLIIENEWYSCHGLSRRSSMSGITTRRYYLHYVLQTLITCFMA